MVKKTLVIIAEIPFWICAFSYVLQACLTVINDEYFINNAEKRGKCIFADDPLKNNRCIFLQEPVQMWWNAFFFFNLGAQWFLFWNVGARTVNLAKYGQ